jgi:hypothetical protein
LVNLKKKTQKNNNLLLALTGALRHEAPQTLLIEQHSACRLWKDDIFFSSFSYTAILKVQLTDVTWLGYTIKC